MDKSMIANLLAQACPSIQYRIRRELLGEAPSTPEMISLQTRIGEDVQVREVLGWQQPDGWLGWNFHGFGGMEAGIRLLCEKDLSRTHPAFVRALESIDRFPDRLARGLGKVSRVFDELGLGGPHFILGALLAHAGAENHPVVRDQLTVALNGMNALLAVKSREQWLEDYRGNLVLRSGMLWPGIYHLRLLAWTNGWRTAGTLEQVRACVSRLVELSPMPAYHVRHKSQLIAPASFCMDDFNPDLNRMDSPGWMCWFHRMELLARLGVVSGIPALKQQVAALAEILAGSGGRFTRRLTHPYFRQWGAYTGLMLEEDWKKPQRRENDLTFRSLIILHYSGLLKN